MVTDTHKITLALHETNSPWSAKATLGLTLLFLILYFIISIVVLAIGSKIEANVFGISLEYAQPFGVKISQRLALDGDFNALNYLVTALCLTPLIFYCAQRRKLSTAAAYLGFDKRPSKASFINFNLALLGYFIFAYFTSNALGIKTPQSMINIYNSTDYLLLLFIAVVIAAPLFEELIFRGFIFKGLASSPLGVIVTIIITSVLFTLIHAGQYDISILAVLFPLAVILGVSRYRSGGLYLPIYLHFINNLYSSVTMYLFMN
ncbi:CPBP family intramembrane glutamic endopeptidase [Colwellia hornerae]|uniref:CPBP family intramembrane metalloprotease n=1 Tax=Colwellia hornerae TaxID=89402 RepID=A0A5C6Q436_9GAMM|nr:CPBP family intramembrane glutamic endopeptidase [Colwellia hornerae]TWX47414.1 CPBP family intramembrane metalloprotease [Colwellia hornerae]TWX54694.1 CPBP family intramembrane metalloprotease [Colwellia hornerae]TWX63407.1 CPBP family intramembrane metalloprotease [Colwellia hornerae]